MPTEDLQYKGPVAVCRNDQCGYFVRSEAHTLKKMGIPGRYRCAYVIAEKKFIPVRTRATDNPDAFCPMGSIEFACESYNYSIEWAERQNRVVEIAPMIVTPRNLLILVDGKEINPGWVAFRFEASREGVFVTLKRYARVPGKGGDND